MLLREIHKVSITVPDPERPASEYLLQNIDKIILKEKKDSELFSRICQEIMKIDDYRFVWIGLVNKKGQKTSIEPISHSSSNNHIKELLDCLVNSINSMDNPLLLLDSIRKYRITRYKKHKKQKNNSADKIIIKNNFLSSVLIPLRHNDSILGLINIFSRQEDSFSEQERKVLLKISENLSNNIRGLKLEIQLNDTMNQLQRALYETIDAITLMSEIKDPYTSGHQKRVAIISSAVATELGLEKDIVDGIYVAGLLHDVGKISVPNDILAKPGKLNEGEFIIIKNHPIVSHNILEHIEFPWPIASTVNQHHERIDGTGYPYGIRGENMSVGARILSVADVVEAMTAHRPYRPALGLKKALSEIEKNKGILYDKEITEACMKVLKEKKIKF